MKTFQYRQWLFISLIAIIFTACGSGGDGGESSAI